MVYGIDVSSYQGDVNWSRVASDGITFAWAKATEGVTYRDPTFTRNRDGAREFGVHFGGYHFARPNHNSPTQEATWFYRTVGKAKPGDLRPVLDLEAGTGDLTVWAGTFLSTLDKLTGARSMLYSGPWFTRPHLHMGALAGWGFWDSEYGANDGRDHGATVPNVAHQFTSRALVRGVVGHVDKNVAVSLDPLLVAAPKPPPPVHRVWPVPVPLWFWTWARWRLDGQTYQRPWDAPLLVPPWAWIRLKQLDNGGSQ